MVWLGPILSVNEVFWTSAILPEMDCAAVCSCVAAVLLGSAGGSAHTTATRIRLAMAAQIIFSSFFIFTASRWFLTGSHRTEDGPPHILKKTTNLQPPLAD